MKKHIVLTLLFLIFATIGGGIIWQFFGSPAKSQTQRQESSIKVLNTKAAQIDPADVNSINSLIDQATFCVVVYRISDFPVLNEVRNRIARAEIAYRNNQRGGVSEEKVAEAVNGLAIKFNAPEYAKTNIEEIRYLRMSLTYFIPNLVGAYRSGQGNRVDAINSSINPELSPVEAVFVSLAMGQQKMDNPYYQMTVAERNARWEELHPPGALEKLPVNKERQDEMNALWDNRVHALTVTQLVEMSHRSLDILGIER